MINLCRDVSTCCSSNIHQKQADSVLLCEGAPLKALSSFWRIDNNRIASVGCLFGNSVRTESRSAGCGRRRDEQQRVRRAGRLRRTLLGGAVEFLAQLSASLCGRLTGRDGCAVSLSLLSRLTRECSGGLIPARCRPLLGSPPTGGLRGP